MASKKSKLRNRNWTAQETELYAKVLANEENQFAFSLERLALKKAANNEVFEHVKKAFDKVRQKKEFREENETNNFTNSKNELQVYIPLDTSIARLRRKYTSLKAEWRNISDRVKKGSGLAPEKEPLWYKILNPVFAETNEELNLASSSIDTSFSLFDKDAQDDMNSEFENSIGNDSDRVSDDDSELDTEFSESAAAPSQQVKAKKKVVVAPHKKRKVVRSQNQGLSNIAKGMEDLASSQIKRTKLLIEADKKRDEMFLKHKADEAEKNREHELRLAQVYASFLGKSNNNTPNQNSDFGNWNQGFVSPRQYRNNNNRVSFPGITQQHQPLSPPNHTPLNNYSVGQQSGFERRIERSGSEYEQS